MWKTMCGLIFTWVSCATALSADPLPSWHDTPPKQAILKFVARVTEPGSPDYVAVADRIAVLDNDGTLWCEQPMYVQLAFALDRVKAVAAQHPDWRQKQPFAAVLSGDMKTVAAAGERGLVELVMASHAGMSSDEFTTIVRDWLAEASHPTLHRPYTACVYQPMLELLDYLRLNQFRTYIVSGGGVELMRVFAEAVYGVPPEQVIGSSIRMKYELRDGKSVLVRLPEIDFIDDKAGKPVAIHKFIGRRPIAAFGNSDGDYEMLRYVTDGPGPRLGVIIHHTDAQREFAYDRDSAIGRLDKALQEAPERGWQVVRIQNDWRTVFPDPR